MRPAHLFFFTTSMLVFGGAARANPILDKFHPSAGEVSELYRRAEAYHGDVRGKLFMERLTPHWLRDNTRLWYRVDRPDGRHDFILVDAADGTRKPAFDAIRLADGLAKASGRAVDASRLPFDEIEFIENSRDIRFQALGETWRCDLRNYACSRNNSSSSRHADRRPAGSRSAPRPPDEDDDEEDASYSAFETNVRSPDGRWTAVARDYDVFLQRSGAVDDIKVTDNSDQVDGYGAMVWSPDSKHLVAYRIHPAPEGRIYEIESSPRGGGRAKLHRLNYGQPGDKLPTFEMWIVDVEKREGIKAAIDPIDFKGPPRLRWSADNRTFNFERTDRGHQRFRVIEVDANTGKARNLIDERSATFIDTTRFQRYPGRRTPAVYYLKAGKQLLWSSERDGWNHLYLTDAVTGTIKCQVTKGPWVMRNVELVDEEKRQIWFRASGVYPEQNPYLIHHFRVNFDGSNLIALTQGDGEHELQFSPGRKYYIDTYSRPDEPPVHELRRSKTGELICTLERADISLLRETGWHAPEVFSAKGRDGQTDIWGIVCRPRHFDPSKKYPVIEDIYAGPQDSNVSYSFNRLGYLESLAELGFIVVQIDGMGTANRSKAFHDVCWKNLGDAGFPDRIAWIKALAARYPYIDVDRVGIFGTSAGGQNAAGAVLFHPEFYKAAVASCGCHDNRVDKMWWNEQWMGYPVGPHYAAQSNVTNAHKLRGKLLLMVGELDTNVPPESTFRVVDALIKAGKDFELLVTPGMDHSDGGRYGERRRRDFFVRHLHGVEPPDRNAAPIANTTSATAAR